MNSSSLCPIGPHGSGTWQTMADGMISTEESTDAYMTNIESILNNTFEKIENIDVQEFLKDKTIDDLPKMPHSSYAATKIESLLKNKEASSHLAEFNGIEKLDLLIYTTLALKDLRDDKEQNILHIAIKRKDLPMVKLILALAPELSQSLIKGKTALHFAAENGVPAEMMEWLTTKAPLLCLNGSPLPIDVNAQDCQGNTALHYALQEGDAELAFKLKKLGADINIENRLRLSPAEQAIAAIYTLISYSGKEASATESDKSVEAQALEKCHGIPYGLEIMRSPYALQIQMLTSLAQEFAPSKGLDKMPNQRELLSRSLALFQNER